MKERIIERYLLLFAMIICSFSEGLRQIVRFPVVHVGNVIILALFAYLVIRGGLKELFSSEFIILLLGGAAFLTFSSLVGLIYGVKPLLYLWSLRRYLIFYCLMGDCFLLFDKKDVSLLYRFLNAVIVVHILLTLFQFFILGIRWDYLNGIFGTKMGGNAGVNILFVINTCVCLYRFHKNEMKWQFLLINFVWMCLNAAMSEIKVYAIELSLALIVYFVITREFKRFFNLLLPITGILLVSAIILKSLYPYLDLHSLNLLKDFSALLRVPHHDNPESLSRMNQLVGLTQPIQTYAKAHRPSIAEFATITGLGLGNAEVSLNGMFDSEFYISNIKLWYWDFLLSMLYIEGGAIGIILYALSWLAVIPRAFIRSLKANDISSDLMKIILSIMFLFLAVYDISLRNNYGYMIWGFCGICYAALDKKMQK